MPTKVQGSSAPIAVKQPNQLKVGQEKSAKPSGVATDTLKLGTAARGPLIDFPAFPIKTGDVLPIEKGNYDGTSFNGNVQVKRFDSNGMDLMINASKFVFSAQIKLSLQSQPDGNIRFLAQRVDSSSPPDQAKPQGDIVKVKQRTPESLVLEAPNGQLISVSVKEIKGKNVLAISYDDSSLILGKPTP